MTDIFNTLSGRYDYSYCHRKLFSTEQSLNPKIKFELKDILVSFLQFLIKKKNTDTDYADDIALLANAPTQAETLIHSQERDAAGIGFHVNAHKTEYMCFNQTGDISILNGSSLKLVNKFPYLGCRFSFTETDIDMRLAKSWTAFDSLSVL